MKKILNRKKLRLKDFDYSSAGAYFVTICTKNRENFFGEIACRDRTSSIQKNNSNFLNPAKIGEFAEKCWHEIPRHFPEVFLDEFCVMPNHIHGIIFLKKENLMRNEDVRSLQQNIKVKTISSIIRGFKIGVTKFARKNNLINFDWQKSFHDRIIRDENELNKIREYIIMNPENWKKDDEFMKL